MNLSSKRSTIWLVWVLLSLGLVVSACGDSAEEDNTQPSASSTATTASTNSGTTSSGSGETTGSACIGVEPGEVSNAPTILSTVDCATCVGSDAPGWMLQDFQPQSCGAGKIYGLDSFRGKPTVVVLLSATCGYCQSQISYLEQMRIEFGLEGVDVNFAVVSLKTTAGAQEEFTSRASFALFQDNDTVDAWGLHDGGKDDFYLYDADLKLAAFLPAQGEINTTLSTEDGYANVKNAIKALTE